VAPEALASGLGSTHIPWLQAGWIGVALVTAIFASRSNRYVRPIALGVAAVAFLWFEFTVFPAIDRNASMRPVWVARHPSCSPSAERIAIYGLSYYAQRAVPVCTILDQSDDAVVR
jgi:hypothetical protein